MVEHPRLQQRNSWHHWNFRHGKNIVCTHPLYSPVTNPKFVPTSVHMLFIFGLRGHLLLVELKVLERKYTVYAILSYTNRHSIRVDGEHLKWDRSRYFIAYLRRPVEESFFLCDKNEAFSDFKPLLSLTERLKKWRNVSMSPRSICNCKLCLKHSV